jgi:hypothetical protein
MEKGAARLPKAKVTAVNGSNLTVTQDGKTYTVTTDGNTKCVRHFWGKCSISEIAVNDELNIWGLFTDDAKTTIQAKMIRNLSQMKRFGAFIGDVTSLGNGTFVIKSKERGNQTVSISSSTKFVGRDERVLTAADIKVGDRVRVKGTWDKTNNTITEVQEVKDFSVPAKVKPSVTPTVSVTNTPTPTP